ncbi:Cas9 inhibitor AcrIIA9 family protein [Paenibacillus silvae]|uniref:Cas9 inhibitor AcrIIA9 family protein n=1 Tax=Paenibacillus silvae TaxID=1325358 RepID=UPI0025A05971|nr:Cas9 inhibitor AcrIIA9 family protein [Paenibacillus silvae]MDM5278822.1 Cas9 inhibitor AcrIIA9 family protein [Paenibacillus silvae]
MEAAIAKLRAEMDGKGTNAYIKLIGDFLIKHVQANPGAAERVAATDKTIAKSLLAMQAEAKKKAVGGMAMLTDEEGFAVVLNYFGLQGSQVPVSAPVVEPKSRRFDVKLDELL